MTYHIGWNRDLDYALEKLPEMEACPSELYKHLLTQSQSDDVKTALVARDNEPIALLGLRRSRNRRSWEPVTNWIIPGGCIAARQGHELQALEALGNRTKIGWWRMPRRPPSGSGRDISVSPTYGMKCTADFDAYWKKTRLHLQQARKRCANFRFELDPPGATEWVVRNWDRHWRGDHGDKLGLELRLAVSDYLQPLARHATLAMYDGSDLVGGALQIAHGKTSVATVMYSRPEYKHARVGKRLMSLYFKHARDAGFDAIDIGGGHGYKSQWAPIMGERAEVTLWPTMQRPLRWASKALKKVRNMRPR